METMGGLKNGGTSDRSRACVKAHGGRWTGALRAGKRPVWLVSWRSGRR